jgi:hypothetical protein
MANKGWSFNLGVVHRTGHVARMGETRNAYRILVGKSVGKCPLGRLRMRREANITMDFKEVGWEVDGTGSASCPVLSFGIVSVEYLGSATVLLVSQSI